MSNSTPRAALPPADAWMTHHDEPMLFPTRAEALQYCDDDEEPIALYSAEQVEQIRRETVQACAAIAEAIVTQHWQDYKRGPHRADPHYQGMSDGAQEVLDAILALLPVKE